MRVCVNICIYIYTFTYECIRRQVNMFGYVAYGSFVYISICIHICAICVSMCHTLQCHDQICRTIRIYHIVQYECTICTWHIDIGMSSWHSICMGSFAKETYINMPHTYSIFVLYDVQIYRIMTFHMYGLFCKRAMSICHIHIVLCQYATYI